MITLQVSPETGSFVSAWSGACQGSGFFCTLTAKEAGQIFKVKVTLGRKPFASAAQYTLSVVVGGSVTPYTGISSAPEGIICGGSGFQRCWLNYLSGTKVLLAAQNAGNYGTDWKVEWIGCKPVGSGVTCEVTMDQVRSVSAIFGK